MSRICEGKLVGESFSSPVAPQLTAGGWEVGGQRVSLIPKEKPLILCESVPIGVGAGAPPVHRLVVLLLFSAVIGLVDSSSRHMEKQHPIH